ncbi:MAG: OB-fold nucleic acid binding domain-containing protein [Nanoarchaeota archaeon]|nr:OB-fold nucleic acid binding domain-containing protein [Nanoarchaeota archaeon]
MEIKDLKAGQGKVDIELNIKSKEPERVFNKYGKDLRVANAIVADNSGEIKLSLWNEDITKFNVGDKIKISNGYVSEFNGEKQLSAGKYGKIELAGAEEAELKKPAKGSKKSDIAEKEF